MILDIARLLLFPALMAFAAASDLFTMTISNRVSLALVAGFLVLALLTGMAPYEILSHVGAGAAVLAVAFACFAMGGRGGAVVRLCPPDELSGLCLAVRRGADAAVAAIPAMAAALPARRPGLAVETACQGERHPLRHRARDRRADGLPGDGMDQGGRSRLLRDAMSRRESRVNQLLS